MKIMLTGATGLLGRSLSARLMARSDIAFTGLAFSRAHAPLIKADLANSGEIESIIASQKPDLVIHAAAERRPDIVDKDPKRAQALNVEATANMAAACRKYGTFMIYTSTDYVYDGTNPPYCPDSPVNPLNEYGKLKLAGEREMARQFGTAQRAAGGLVIRIPMLYGPVEFIEESSVIELARHLKAGKPCKVDNWSTRYPLHVDDVAAAIEILVDTWAAEPSKIEAARFGNEAGNGGLPLFLLSGPIGITKYGMVMEMARSLGLDASFVEADSKPSTSGAPRPKDCRMDSGRLQTLGYAPRLVFPARIKPILEPFFTPSTF
ncbi:MAG: SDR family oxidoreductase [Spirochaetaceae bacterium]|nr:SDR family oxidoreductase [Spirochaetaceae bacterium]